MACFQLVHGAVISTNKHPTPIIAPAAGAASSGADRDNHFNFLRLCFAALVLLDHAPILVDGDARRELLTQLFGFDVTSGEVAVSGFFVLSGYLVVQSWQRRPRLVEFLSARALRIYPGFVTAGLISVFVVGGIGAAHVTDYLTSMDYATVLQNLVIPNLPATPATFVGTNFANVNGSMWTISHECGCYLCVALLGMVGLRRRPRIFLTLGLCMLVGWWLPQFTVVLVRATFKTWGLAWAHRVLLCMVLLVVFTPMLIA